MGQMASGILNSAVSSGISRGINGGQSPGISGAINQGVGNWMAGRNFFDAPPNNPPANPFGTFLRPPPNPQPFYNPH